MTKSIGERAGKAAQENHPELVSFMGVTGLTALDIFNVGNMWAFVALTCVAFAAIPLSYLRNGSLKLDSDHIQTLRQVITEGHRNFYDVWDDKAREIYQELDMDIRSRLSVYKYDAELKKFRLLGRFSDNADYRARTRHLYPADQGVIGKAWASGECHEKALPNPASAMDKYLDENLRKYSIPSEVTSKFTMKSTCLWGYSLRDHNKVPFAVVVVESTKRDDVNPEKLRAEFDAKHSADIRAMMKTLQFMEPSIRIAQNMGF